MADAPEVQEDGDGVAVQDAIIEQPQAFDLSSADAQAAIKAAAEAATKDLRAKLAEFRNTNDAYRKSGLTPEQVSEIASNMRKNKEIELAATGKFEDLIKMRMEPIQRDADAKLDAANQTIEELRERYRQTEAENLDLVIGTGVADAMAQHKDIFPETAPVIRKFAKEVWRKDESGTLRPYRPNGAPWVGKNQKDITFFEWINELRDPYPFLFKVPQGVTARGGPGKSSIDYINSLADPAERIEQARKMGLVKPQLYNG